MWDSCVPDEEIDISGDHGCSNAVTREAAPSSATNDEIFDIAQRMPPGAVNLEQVARAMGRGPNYLDDGELDQKLEDDGDMHRDIRKVTDERTLD